MNQAISWHGVKARWAAHPGATVVAGSRVMLHVQDTGSTSLRFI